MALVPHKITALAESDAQGTDGKNIVAGAVVSLYDPNGTAVTLFDNESGANGSTAKQTDATGQVVVYVTAGEYDEEVNGSVRRRVTVGGNGVISYGTTAELQASRPVKTGARAENRELNNAPYVLAAEGYAALPGDITAANGRVWQLMPLAATKRKAYSARAFGVIGDGVTDDTAAIASGLSRGEVHGNGLICRVTSRINVTSDNAGIVGDIQLVGDSSAFNREDGLYNNDDGTILYVTGNNFTMSSVRIALDSNANGENTTTGLVLRGNTFDVQNCEFDTFSKSKVVRIESGREGSVFNYNYIHDCLMDSATNGQLTAIDIDDNRAPSPPVSTGIEIAHNRIKNMLVSASFEAAFFYQSDGINVSFAETNNLHIHHNTIDKVGECIDCFGRFNDIHDNFLLNAEVGGVKLINGSSYNKIHNNTIKSPRTYGITLAGNATAGRDVIGNKVTENTVYNVNPNSDSLLSTSGIALEGVGASVPMDNVVDGNCFIDCGNAARLIFSETSDSTNIVKDVKYMGTTPATLVTNNGGGLLVFSDKSRVNAYPSAQSIPNTGAALDLSNVEDDLQGELSGAVYTSKVPRSLNITCSIRTGGANAGKIWTLDIAKNGAVVERAGATVAANGDFYLRCAASGIKVDQGDEITFVVNHNEAASIPLTSSPIYSVTISEA